MTSEEYEIQQFDKLCHEYAERIHKLETENEDMHGKIMSLQAYIDNHEEIWKSNAHIENKKRTIQET